MRMQMAQLRMADYEKRITIERKSRAKRKEAQRPLKNSRQQIRNRLLTGSKYTISSREIEKLYSQPCYRCETTKNTTIDHIIPLSRGGNHSIGNLMTLCRKCNASKGKKFLVEWNIYIYMMKVAGK